MTMQRNEPQAVQQCHDLLAWIIPVMDQFPRSRRFTLGERIESVLIEILELLVSASYSKHKSGALQKANERLAGCRHLWRLAFELKAIPMRRYEHGAQRLETLGAQIGGWTKHSARA